MIKVTAATSFLGEEGMWRAGDTKEVSANRAHELIEAGFAVEASAATEEARAKPKPAADRKTKPATGPDETK